MNKVMICLFSILVGCSGHQQAPTSNAKVYDFKQPPTDLELTVSDHRTVKHPHPVVITNEEFEYNSSIDAIQKRFQDEYLKLTMHESVYGKDSEEYKAFLNKCCEVDMYIDSRSGHHTKPYCKKSP